MRPKTINLAALAYIAFMALLMIAAGEQGLVRVLLGALLALVLPGAVLSDVLLHGTSLGVPERVLLTLGLSLIVSVLGAFLLQLTPWGLRPVTWALLLALITWTGAGFSYFQSRQARPTPLRLSPHRMAWQHAALLILALALGVGSVASARTEAARQNATDFTQLWMLPAGGQVNLGIRNLEGVPRSYRLELRHAGNVLQSWAPIELASDGTWEMTVAVPVKSGAVEALLYRLDRPRELYRRTELWPENHAAESAPVRLLLPSLSGSRITSGK